MSVSTADKSSQPYRSGFPWGGMTLFALSVVLLYAGWQIRDERYWTAEYGFGYALGIVGGSMMLLLLLYPLRKHWRVLRRAGPIKWWFRTHMIFGLFGPIAVLYHANFQMGSLNSTVALWSMLVVSASGVIGRLIYTRIHYGLYGSRMTLQSLRQESEEGRARFASLTGSIGDVDAQLSELEKHALIETRGVLHGIWRVLRMGGMTRRVRRSVTPQLTRGLLDQADIEGWDNRRTKQARKELKAAIKEYFTTVRRVSRLALYERLFAWWHVLHLPLFIMLVVSGITHVVAVHRY